MLLKSGFYWDTLETVLVVEDCSVFGRKETALSLDSTLLVEDCTVVVLRMDF